MTTHLIVLRHPATGDERSIRVTTPTNAFNEVHRQVCHLRSELNLLRYEIWESQEISPAF